jgi:hypothetical protein
VLHLRVGQFVPLFRARLGNGLVVRQTTTFLAQLAVDWWEIQRGRRQTMHARVLNKEILYNLDILLLLWNTVKKTYVMKSSVKRYPKLTTIDLHMQQMRPLALHHIYVKTINFTPYPVTAYDTHVATCLQQFLAQIFSCK